MSEPCSGAADAGRPGSENRDRAADQTPEANRAEPSDETAHRGDDAPVGQDPRRRRDLGEDYVPL